MIVANKKSVIKDWIEQNSKIDRYCKCGCGKKIIIRWPHKYKGIPEYIHGHNGDRTRSNWVKDNLKIKRFCKCGCNQEIKIKVNHYYGIPEYISGHQMKDDKIKERVVGNRCTRKWVEEKSKEGILCACGCKKKIVIKRLHKFYGIPKYISGHNRTSAEIREWLKINSSMDRFCKCGCGGRIKVVRDHYDTKIPDYLLGHDMRDEKIVNKFYNTDNNVVKVWLRNNIKEKFCSCGCGGKIIINKSHKYYGIPNYIHGHDVGKRIANGELITYSKYKGNFYSDKTPKPVYYQSFSEFETLKRLNEISCIKEIRRADFYLFYIMNNRIYKYIPDFKITLTNNKIIIIEVKPTSLVRWDNRTIFKLSTLMIYCKNNDFGFLVIPIVSEKKYNGFMNIVSLLLESVSNNNYINGRDESGVTLEKEQEEVVEV